MRIEYSVAETSLSVFKNAYSALYEPQIIEDFHPVEEGFLQDTIPQVLLDQTNLLIDNAEVGQEIFSKMSQKEKFDPSETVVLIPHMQRLGDAIYMIGALNAVKQYNNLHPEKAKKIEILTPFNLFFDGIAEENSQQISVTNLCDSNDPRIAKIFAEYINDRYENVFIIGNTPRKSGIYRELAETAHHKVTGMVDVRIFRFGHKIIPWKSTKHPYGKIESYPSQLFRLMEMIIGEKLVEDPSNRTVDIYPSKEIKAISLALEENFGNINYHCIAESASQKSKRFEPQQLYDLLAQTTAYCQRYSGTEKNSSKILFLEDATLSQKERFDLNTLPADVRKYIDVFSGDLKTLFALLIRPNIKSFTGLETGVTHLASAIGKRTLRVFAYGNSKLWTTGQPDIYTISAGPSVEANMFNHVMNFRASEIDDYLLQSVPAEDISSFWESIFIRD